MECEFETDEKIELWNTKEGVLILEFRERLRALRLEAGLTQKQIGEYLHYGYTAVCNYEAGRNEPSIGDLIQLAKLFKVSLDYLLGQSDVRNPYEK